MSRRAVNTKYKYHISWNLAVPFTVTLILRTYTEPPTKGLGISINRPDKPGRSDAGGCRPSSASLRFPARASFWMGSAWKVPAYWFLDSSFLASTFQLPCSWLLDSSFLASTFQLPCYWLPRNLPYLLPLPWKPRKSTVSNNTSRICAILPNTAFTANREIGSWPSNRICSELKVSARTVVEFHKILKERRKKWADSEGTLC